MDVLIPYRQMRSVFREILERNGFDKPQAETCAEIFAQNSLDGVNSHGVNRFARFVEMVWKGYVKPDQGPSLVHAAGAVEQWNGNLGPGPANALTATRRAMEIAAAHGVGCVGLANTNHWMRAGYYGWEAARKGYAFIAWTNTLPNAPAWGARDCRIGNNPLAMAAPYGSETIVLDMAMTQYSYGALEAYAMSGKKLPAPGGYDEDGALTIDPAAILQSQRPLPAGFWKGSGLAILLDVLAALISGGDATCRIGRKEAEHGVSQVFIAIHVAGFPHFKHVESAIVETIDYLHRSLPAHQGEKVFYPGERTLQKRKENTAKGIPVNARVWDEIVRLAAKPPAAYGG